MVAKFFNTAGPVNLDIHYKLDPLERIKIDEIEELVAQQKYFVLHAPRQTGKTTCLLAMRDHFNAIGEYRAVYCNIEAGQAGREDVNEVIGTVCSTIVTEYGYLFDHDLSGWDKDFYNANARLTELLSYLSSLDAARPFVLFIDEIDALIGDSLISVLRQIRAGYGRRPQLFPQSIILCGVRDVRDYRMHTKHKEIITGGSAFNIKAKSLRVGNFSKQEVRRFYDEHTAETGQRFEDSCFGLIYRYTGGQPWLVNALGYELTSEMKNNRDRSVVITAEMVRQAKENLVYRRDTHLDQLIDKLQEERVRRVIAPILSTEECALDNIPSDDLQYVIDLGLVERKGSVQISNDIYREVIPRELTWVTQSGFAVERSWYLNDNGTLNMHALIEGFQEFFRKHSEHWMQTFQYKEAGPQLLLQAFLQRIVNGGGLIEREYGLGRKRTDLYVRMPHEGGYQEVILELKIQYGSRQATIDEAMPQTLEYMDKCGTQEGHIIIFDRSPKRSWDEKIFCDESFLSQGITIWGC